jgi:site-specific recombinase
VIGVVNVVVSFAFALQLALRASDDVGSSRLLMRVGLRQLLGRTPRRRSA